MALTELIFQVTPAQIGSVVLDASVKEVHTASAKATRHPVESEDGSTLEISDNIQIDPLQLQIDGVVTNTPAEWLGTSFEDHDLAQSAHQELLDNLLTGKLITITTTLLEYPNMVLENLQVNRDAQKGNALYFSASAKMVTLVTLEETAVGDQARPVTESTKASGTQATKATTETTKTSALSKWLGFGG